jgi:hypothetical protein
MIKRISNTVREGMSVDVRERQGNLFTFLWRLAGASPLSPAAPLRFAPPFLVALPLSFPSLSSLRGR